VIELTGNNGLLSPAIHVWLLSATFVILKHSITTRGCSHPLAVRHKAKDLKNSDQALLCRF